MEGRSPQVRWKGEFTRKKRHVSLRILKWIARGRVEGKGRLISGNTRLTHETLTAGPECGIEAKKSCRSCMRREDEVNFAIEVWNKLVLEASAELSRSIPISRTMASFDSRSWKCPFPIKESLQTMRTPLTDLVMATHCGVLFRFSSSPFVPSGDALVPLHTSSPESSTSLSSFGLWDLLGGLGSDMKWGALYKTRGAKNTEENTTVRSTFHQLERALGGGSGASLVLEYLESRLRPGEVCVGKENLRDRWGLNLVWWYYTGVRKGDGEEMVKKMQRRVSSMYTVESENPDLNPNFVSFTKDLSAYLSISHSGPKFAHL